jgi:hypothetical protein
MGDALIKELLDILSDQTIYEAALLVLPAEL